MQRFSWNLKKKAVVLLMLFTVTPILIMGFTSNMVSRNIIEQKSNNLYLNTLEKLAQYISGDLQYVSEAIYSISKNELVQTAMKQKINDPEEKENMQKLLKKELMPYSSINRIKYPIHYLMLSNQGELYTTYFYSPFGDWEKTINSIQQQEWYSSLSSQVYDGIWIGFCPNLLLKNGEEQIYFASNITGNNKNYGILIVGFNQSYFSKTMNNFKFSTNSSIFLIEDTKKSVLRGEDISGLYNKLPEDELQNMQYMGPRKLTIENSKYMAAKVKIHPTSTNKSWTLCMLTPVSDIYRESSLINYVTVALLAFAIISIMILIVVINKWLVLPITDLSRLMGSVGKGDLNVRTKETQKDEIGQLERGFNRMVARLQENIERMQQDEKKKRKLEIQVLQAQINPHFIRNTLNTIRWMAELKKATGISRALISFIKLMDYSFSYQNTMVTIEEEVSYLNEYIYLQRLRYQNKFSFDIQVEEKLKSAKILKLLLQPIVENSILHGLEKKNGFGKLIIRIYSEEERYLVVLIEDNGVGIEADKIQKIIEGHGQYTNRGTNHHIGFGNVQERIRLNFGEEYGMTLRSEVGKGTQVFIRLPIIEGGQHEGIDD